MWKLDPQKKNEVDTGIEIPTMVPANWQIVIEMHTLK